MVHKIKLDSLSTAATSRFRSIASQVIACMCPNLLLLDLGMAVNFTTIAIPDLLNSPNGLSLNDTQASWFGSLSFLTQPLGAVISGPVVDYFGRKKASILVNIPYLVAWILMYYSWNVPTLFIANGLLGLGTGIMEAPINAYVGEVCEPSIRGALCTVTQVFLSLGIFIIYILGSVVNWRVAALICFGATVANMLLVILVPETPVWLLSKGREKDALKSLCYLRGWTSPDQVREEFEELALYTKKLDCCVICSKTEDGLKECPHGQMNFFKRSLLKFKYVMLGKETLRPWTLVMLYFTFYTMSGMMAVRPNMVNVCGAFGMADDGKNIVLIVGVLTFVTSGIAVVLIKVLGKRKLALLAMLGTAICSLALSLYANYNIDNSVFTYDVKTFPSETSYVPLVFFYAMAIFTGFAIPWVLVGEVFPFRSRACAQGIAAAGNYIIMFIAAKTFINLEITSHLCGTFAVYAAFGFAGTIYLYFFLPETEGMTLEEIELFYNGEIRTFADDPFINLFKRFKKKA